MYFLNEIISHEKIIYKIGKPNIIPNWASISKKVLWPPITKIPGINACDPTPNRG